MCIQFIDYLSIFVMTYSDSYVYLFFYSRIHLFIHVSLHSCIIFIKTQIENRSISHPCFGSIAPSTMTSKEWWMEVVRNTYKTTETLDNCIDFKEIEKILPESFDMLYNQVFNTKEGWLIKEDAEYTLVKLSEWRDQGAGPKIGVIANYDIRLNSILEGRKKSLY